MKIYIVEEYDILCETSRIHSAFFNKEKAENKKTELERLQEDKEAKYVEWANSGVNINEQPDSDFDYSYFIEEVEVI